MKKSLFAAVAACVVVAPLLVLAFAPAPDAGSRAVEFKTWQGYAESRESGLKGADSYLVIPSKTELARLFDPVFTPRGAPDPVPKGAFDTQLFVAVIKRGDVLWTYKVEKVTANGDTLTVHYRATPLNRGDSPRGETAREKGTAPFRTTERARPATQKAAPPRPRDTGVGVPAQATARAPVATAKGTFKEYPSTERSPKPSATFDSPLILSVPRDKYLTVVFIENGKKVGSARAGN